MVATMVPKSIVVGRSSSASWLATGTAARGVAGRGRHAARARHVRFDRRVSKEPQRAQERVEENNISSSQDGTARSSQRLAEEAAGS